MFAINHAATALIIKKIFKEVPIAWLLISVQFMELLWVFLNYLGVERTTTEKEFKYVGNIHLSYMPFSHSIAAMVGVSILAWFVISKWFNRPEIGLAVSIGIVSHLVLDLITHSRDMAIAPFIKGPKFGLGLYANLPVPSFWK
jgi:LexA-binding, inner membrane-associated putative hydrolase